MNKSILIGSKTNNKGEVDGGPGTPSPQRDGSLAQRNVSVLLRAAHEVASLDG